MHAKRWLDWFRLSRREYFADFFITPPITAMLIVLSLAKSASWFWPLEFAGGALAWTLYEYALHRFVLHHLWFARDLHNLHHDDQRDYIGTHPLATILLYAALWLAFGAAGGAFAAGFSFAYIAYSALHTAFHYSMILPGHWLHGLKRHHALHHRFEKSNFGISTKAWDWAFGTLRH